MSETKRQLENIKKLKAFESEILSQVLNRIKDDKSAMDNLASKFRAKRQVLVEAEEKIRLEEKQREEALRAAKLAEERAKLEEAERAAAEKQAEEASKSVPEEKTEQPVSAEAGQPADETAENPQKNAENKPATPENESVEAEPVVRNERPRAEQQRRGASVDEPAKKVFIPQQRENRQFGNRGDRPQTDRRRDNAPAQRPFTPRPAGAAGSGFKSQDAVVPPFSSSKPAAQKGAAGKKKVNDTEKNKQALNKRTLIRKGYVAEDMDEDRMGSRRFKSRKVNKNTFTPAPIVIEKAVITTENLTIKQLSDKIGHTAVEIVNKLFSWGQLTNVNANIDFDTAELVAAEFGIELEKKVDKTNEELLFNLRDEADDEKDLVTRPPVVTIMGHVDHGKTSLLDYIRKSSVASGEAGGITQHIGAYTVSLNNSPITFLDTPGHEAFTSMRMRGAQVTDIAVLVVAADDGVMPQTVEAINHSKAAGVPIIVAINKMDRPGADPQRIMQQLTEYDILSEEWGGDTIMVPVSAKTGEGVEKLLESILLLAEMKELKANPNRAAKGTIVEARLDKGRGPVATVLVQNGTLKVGDFMVAGTAVGRIRAMVDDKGRDIKKAGPSTPASVLGFTEVPNAGDQLMAVLDEKLAKEVAEERKNKLKIEKTRSDAKFNLDDVFNRINEGEIKELNLIIKADVQGSVEAVRQSLMKLGNEEVKVKVIHGAVGAINESDVMLAETAKAIVIGFNVRPDNNAKQLAEKRGVEIRCYRIIYDAIDDVQKAMKGMLAPKFRENVLGHAEVRKTFKVSSVGTIAGCYVTDGKIVRNSKLRLLRDNVVVYEGEFASLKRVKDDVKEVLSGFECGLSIDGYNDIKEGDVIESFVMEQVNED